jgi:hypothetical protein
MSRREASPTSRSCREIAPRGIIIDSTLSLSVLPHVLLWGSGGAGLVSRLELYCRTATRLRRRNHHASGLLRSAAFLVHHADLLVAFSTTPNGT